MIEINNKTRAKIDIRMLTSLTGSLLKHYKVADRGVSIAIVGDAAIRKLNQAFLKRDRATDVLAFTDGDNELGEVIINYAQVKRQASKYSSNIKEEMKFVLVHGLLHLLGFTDSTEKERERMDKATKEFIEKFK